MQSHHTRSRRRRTNDRRYAPQKYLQVLLLACLCLTSCKSRTATYTGIRMTIPYQVTAVEDARIPAIIDEVFDEVDLIYNDWNPLSEVSHLNRVKAGVKIAISPQLGKLLVHIDEIVQMTGGLFDPTVGPLIAQLKRGEAVEDLSCVGWKNVHVEDGFFWKDCDETALDLGGVAKGYAVDLLVERLNEAGFKNVYVSWGGDLRVSGSHPTGRPWRVGVRDSDGAIVETVELRDQAMATSGDYQQQWEVNGKRVTHVCNPRTLCPLEVQEIPCSVTTVANSCLVADALATALMIDPTLDFTRSGEIGILMPR